MDEIFENLKRFRKRIRIIDFWELSQRTYWLAALITLLVQIIGRLLPLPNLWWWMIAPLIIWMLSLSTWFILYPNNHMKIAQRVDLELSLKERISTALALHEQNTDFPEELVIAQREDAILAAQHVQPSRDFPVIWHRRYLWRSGAILLVSMILLLVPNPMDLVLEQRRAIAQESAQQAQEIEKIREEIVNNEKLSDETQEELVRKLNELAEALRNNPGDLEQALADITRIQQNLSNLTDENSRQQQMNLEALAAQLNMLARKQSEPGREIETAVDSLEALSQELESLSEEERQKLAASLAQMAAMSSQAGDMALAQALSSLSQAVQSGNQQAADTATNQAQAALAQSAQKTLDQQAIQQVLSQLTTSSQSLTQSGKSVAQNQSGSQGQNANQSGQPGSQSGSQTGNQSGSPSSGGGSQANILPPSTRTGRAGVPQGDAAPPSEGQLGNQVYAPRQSSEGNNEPFFIPGQDTNQGETQSREGQGQLPGATNSSLVPYSQVYYSYMQALNQAIDQIYIPASLEAFIQAYFTQLEP